MHFLSREIIFPCGPVMLLTFVSEKQRTNNRSLWHGTEMSTKICVLIRFKYIPNDYMGPVLYWYWVSVPFFKKYSNCDLH